MGYEVVLKHSTPNAMGRDSRYKPKIPLHFLNATIGNTYKQSQPVYANSRAYLAKTGERIIQCTVIFAKPDNKGASSPFAVIGVPRSGINRSSNEIKNRLESDVNRLYSGRNEFTYYIPDSEMPKIISGLNKCIDNYNLALKMAAGNARRNIENKIRSSIGHSLYTEVFDKDEYLAHHGILGMKWGIRRYQNADGSLTDEGRKHYGNTDRNEDATKSDRKKAIAKYGHDAYALQKQAKKALIKGDEKSAKEYNELQKKNRDKQKELRKEFADERVANYGRKLSVAGELGKSMVRSYGLALISEIALGAGTSIGAIAGGPTGALAGYGITAAILGIPVAALTTQSSYVATRNISDIADSDKISGENTIRRKKK